MSTKETKLVLKAISKLCIAFSMANHFINCILFLSLQGKTLYYILLLSFDSWMIISNLLCRYEDVFLCLNLCVVNYQPRNFLMTPL